MKVLLLGGYGFIGTNILKYVELNLSDEYTFIVFDKTIVHPYGLSFKCIEKTYAGDFADSQLIKSILSNHKFDLIIHSISSTIPLNSDNVRFDIESNLIPSVELLKSMADTKNKKIVFLSSGGAIYGDSSNKHKNKESENVFPKSSYGVIKLAIEKYLFQYAELYQIEPLILRLSNPYGPNHFSIKQGVINVALRLANEGQKLTIWGNGQTRKDYIFIEDFCEILFILINKGIPKSIINIGSSQILSIIDIVTQIKMFYPKFEWEYTNPNKFDVSHTELDTGLLTEKIGPYSFTPFKNGLLNTKIWLEKYGYQYLN